MKKERSIEQSLADIAEELYRQNNILLNLAFIYAEIQKKPLKSMDTDGDGYEFEKKV